MENQPPRRSFREVYREERAKVREERRRRNRYADWLGIIALVGLGLGFVGPLINVMFGERGPYGQGPEFTVSPALIIGAICGVLWLVVKAVTSQQPPSS